MNALRSIVDDHTARRIGNGTLPAPPDLFERVRTFYDVFTLAGLPQIAQHFDLTIADVLEALGMDYYCRACGRVADLWQGKVGEGVYGDHPVEFWATGCCLAPFVDGGNNNYTGPNPWAEAQY